ncbi:MAG: DUF805 domain-containing protein [Alphaproteobacteria bacterium]|nr:DUF805 domain-containing protein [Alphaproteobacteria bacterium]MBV9420386.1 DUF805 domain-containing protein [Alphaproteobacteria bacterium]MBV9542019.1 DUF805 domain-containing protein [Alphaproteobacteria bacterium]MBV9904222.1 DUF805 domain-containing protein [Alphaproteobacteria bacterium]
MGFGEAVRTCLRKYATFGGRARRSEYWYFFLFSLLLRIAASIVDVIVFGGGPDPEAMAARTPAFESVINLVLFLPSLSVAVRRLHDTNRSGWLMFGFILYLVVVAAGVFLGFASAFATHTEPSETAIAVAVALALGAAAYGLFLFVLTVLDGTPGDNRYGPDPKGRAG